MIQRSCRVVSLWAKDATEATSNQTHNLAMNSAENILGGFVAGDRESG